MPDVIDLLSSSPPRKPSQASASSLDTSTSHPITANTPAPARNWDALDNIFDSWPILDPKTPVLHKGTKQAVPPVNTPQTVGSSVTGPLGEKRKSPVRDESILRLEDADVAIKKARFHSPEKKKSTDSADAKTTTTAAAAAAAAAVNEAAKCADSTFDDVFDWSSPVLPKVKPTVSASAVSAYAKLYSNPQPRKPKVWSVPAPHRQENHPIAKPGTLVSNNPLYKTSTASIASQICHRLDPVEDPILDSSPVPFRSGKVSSACGSTNYPFDDIVISSSQPESPPMVDRTKKRRVMDEFIELTSESDDDFPDVSKVEASRELPGDHIEGFSVRKSGFGRTVTASLQAVKRTGGLVGSASASGGDASSKTQNDKSARATAKAEAMHQKKRDKERAVALAEANKIYDKKDTCRELIVHLSVDLDAEVLETTRKVLQDLGVQVETCHGSVAHLVKWKRKIRSQYNATLGIWEPVPLKIRDEETVLCILSAEEFASMVSETSTDTICSYVAKIKTHFPSAKLQFLLSGLAAFLRRNHTRRSDEFLAIMPDASAALRRRAAANPSIDPDFIEDALLELQVMHKVSIHQTSTPLETARWVGVFTQYVSVARYRRVREERMTAGFCMEVGQVRTGEDAGETFVKMMGEVGRVTGPVGWGLWRAFGGVMGLVKGFREGGMAAVEGVRRVRNREGDEGEGVVGGALSKRLFKVFMGRDEMSMDV